MSRTVFPFVAKDVSSLARALSRELEECDRKPGHVQLLNMLTRSAGYKNFQHFRAQFDAQDRLEREPPVPEPVDHVRVERVTRHFDVTGNLVRWPAKASERLLCLWHFWSRIPAGVVHTEKQINEILNEHHGFGDHALLRRELYDHQLVLRTPDGREYRRIERRPPADALALIRHLDTRRPSPRSG
jgi:hypothetical protein